MKYFLVSYYARLKGGGFGFGRKYISMPEDKHFHATAFEEIIANEAGLSVNSICVMNRVIVCAEEYILNTDNNSTEVNELGGPDEPEVIPNKETERDLRSELDGSLEDHPHRL
jgi:hypothetical protein